MPDPDQRRIDDPIAQLLELTRALEEACASLKTAAAGAWPSIVELLDRQLPRYRQDLEQSLIPLLKRRLRNDEDDEEQALARELFLLSKQLEDLAASWPRVRVLLEAGTPVAAAAQYAQDWEDHLDTMDSQIIPALSARLGRCDLDLLGQAMARHRGLDWQAIAACDPDDLR